MPIPGAPMAASVTIHHKAFGDDRIHALARIANYPGGFDEALGKLAKLWSVCTEEQTSTPTIKRIRTCLGHEGERWLVESDLGERMEDGSIRVRGTEGRTEWYGDLPKQQALAGRKRASTGARDPGGRFQRTDTAGPATPAVDQRITSALVQRDQPSPALDPESGKGVLGSGPVSHVSPEHPDQRVSGDRVHGARAAEPPRPANTLHERTISPVGASDPDPRGTERRRLKRVIAAEHVRRFNALRTELDVKIPAMQPVGDPAQRELDALVNDQVTLDGFEEAARHSLDVREAEARAADPPTLKFFGASMWTPSNFGRTKSMQVGEDRRGPRAATDPRVGRVDPSPPTSYPDGKVEIT